MIEGNIRKYLFWILDVLNGSPILKNLKEIKNINDSNDEALIERYINKRLGELLKYAQNNVPYYQNFKHIELSDFPVSDKLTYKKNINKFCSVEFKKVKLYKAITSGSTGTPFVSFQNEKKKKRNTADVIYFGRLAGYKLGEPLFYLKIWSDNNRKSGLVQFLQNIIPIDVIKLSNKNIKQLLDKIDSKNGKAHINSYASALEEVCKYLDNGFNSGTLKNLRAASIIAQSEALTSETREKLQKYFKSTPCSRYSNLENGIIAQQTLNNNNLFLINRASYFVEILKMDSDIPVKPNELGRIVVTDLFNYAMPFIRYDTGDIGRFAVNKDNISDYNYLKEIQGIKLDLLLNTKGEIVSSYIMYKNMFKYPEIDQFQLIQEGKKDYRFIISMKGIFEQEVKLKNEFLNYLGKDANFEIEYVKEIPLLSSGKRRKIINNYLKNKSAHMTGY